jgi:membrane associated rhomboid family serine protease
MLTARLKPVLFLIALIWVVEVVNFLLAHRLVSFGILPRHYAGLLGIPVAPLLHGSLLHAASNTLPMLFLGGLTLAGGKKRFWITTIGVALLSGAMVWLFAREAYHVGASGLVFGYFGAIVARAFLERSMSAVVIGVATVAAYGGLIWGVLPLRSHVSFESHLFGLIAGMVVVRLVERRR